MIPTNEELIEAAYGWAETPKRSVCGMAVDVCPTTTHGYCVDCHSTAYAAAKVLRWLFITVRALLGLAEYDAHQERT